jgi:hypothetical protein
MAPHLRVIEGGAGDGARPIVWNRCGLGKAKALHLVDHESPDLSVIALDHGEPFLVGVRDVRRGPQYEAVIGHWIAWAKAEGAEVIDRRTPEPVLAAQRATTEAERERIRLSTQAHQLEALQASRRAQRAVLPLPAGGLFDETARNQQELF